jgi:hypothetical protein
MIEVLVLATVLPFVLWGVLAVIVRKDMQWLTRIYPWLRALSWGTWSLGVVMSLAALIGGFQHRQVFLFFASAAMFNGGIQLMRGWVQRRVDHDSIPRTSPDGWWPAKRDF